jgi:tetratricopeptide (TPR) repeat protein
MKKVTSLAVVCLTLASFAVAARAQTTAEEFYRRGDARFRTRDIDGAISDLDRAIELKPDYAQAHAARSRLRLMKGQLDAALTDLDRAIQLDPTQAAAYAERGRMRMMRNDLDGALADFDGAIARGHRSDEVYGARAHLKLMVRKFEQAINDFTVAISLRPTRISYQLGRASARAASGDSDGALVDLNAIIAAYEERAAARAAAGKGKERAPEFEMASPPIVGPEQVVASKEGGKVVEKTRMEAVVTMNPSAGGDPEQFEYLHNVAGAYSNRAALLARRGDWEAAQKDYERAIEINPREASAYYTRGRFLAERGDLKAALADFTKAAEAQPRQPFIYLERGVTLLRLGRDAEAEKDFERVLQMDPSLERSIEVRRAEALRKREGTQQPQQ